MLINNTNNTNILENINKMICSFSSKTDFYELESDFYSSISKIIPAHATALYFFNSKLKKPIYISSKGVDKDFLSYYETNGRDVDPLRNWIMSKRFPNQSQLLLGLEGWKKHPVYNIVKTASIDFAMQAPIISDSKIIGTINFGREYKEGPFKKQDLHTISILSHFLGMAFIHSLGSKSFEQYNILFNNSINNMKQGIVVTDSNHNVNYANHSAKETIFRNFLCDKPEKEFASLLIDISKNEIKANNQLINKLDIRTCPMPGTNKSKTIVFIDDNPPPEISKIVKSILTARELDVLLQLERGKQNKEIAQNLFISVNTVKRHLDNMFAKLNVNSRTQLVSKFYYLNSL